ncbi:hypothetical protein, partial [Shewanella sp. 10N.286.51.B7]|uniref:hypothetical protein n=1 Tax=Shewanella sp. 10N.286.51.B7 TaxID=1880836 RepID=UPI0010559B79
MTKDNKGHQSSGSDQIHSDNEIHKENDKTVDVNAAEQKKRDNKAKQAVKKIDTQAQKLKAKELRDTAPVKGALNQDLVADKTSHSLSAHQTQPSTSEKIVSKADNTTLTAPSERISNVEQQVKLNAVSETAENIPDSTAKTQQALVKETGSTETTGIDHSGQFRGGHTATQDISQFKTAKISLAEHSENQHFSIDLSSQRIHNPAFVPPQEPKPLIPDELTGTGTGT